MMTNNFTFTLPPNAEKIYDDNNGYHFLVSKTEYLFRYEIPLENNTEWKYFTNDREVIYNSDINNYIIKPARTFIYTKAR